MNKLAISKMFLVLVCLIIITGCDNYLEENPDNRVEIDNVTKAAQLLTNSYSEGSYSFTEWMSDNVAFTFGTTKLPVHEEAYTWDEFTGNSQDTPEYFWTTTYGAIAHANEVLAVIDQLPGDKGQKNAVKGEALLARAYGHFMLVNLFAKHYDPETADEDLGIPYVEEPETVFIKKYTRLSVEETYDKIEDDLLDGLDLVDGSYYANSGKYHFTRNAALAFASRFYLFKSDFNNCIRYSNQLLGSDPTIFVKNIPALLQQRINTEDYIRLYHAPTDDSNLLLIRQVSNFHAPNYGHWPTDELYNGLRVNPFGVEDVRLDPAWVAGDNGIALTKFEFLFQRSSLTSNVGLNYTISLGFRGEEVLLNRAEAYIRKSEPQVNAAIADLQALASRRYLNDDGSSAVVDLATLKSFYGNNDDRSAVFFYIVDERIKEFMHEGLRWFDIKRFNIPVTHNMPNGSFVFLEADDNRKVMQIPKPAVDVGGLEQNPR